MLNNFGTAEHGCYSLQTSRLGLMLCGNNSIMADKFASQDGKLGLRLTDGYFHTIYFRIWRLTISAVVEPIVVQVVALIFSGFYIAIEPYF